ncbi:MAG: molecular chaperone TorD family protein [Gallionella sp.]
MQNQNAVAVETLEDVTSVEEMRARIRFYHLLAGAFVEEPGAGYLAAMRAPLAMAALTGLGVNFESDFTDASLHELAETLACEYATLFVTSGGCPPVESARLTGRFQQQPYHEVKATYKRCGFELQQGKHAVFEDQLGVELSFVAAMLERQAALLESGDLAAANRLDKEVKRFWATHLGRWVRGFSTLLERVTLHSFYREMARMLYAFTENELAVLQVRVDDVDGGREAVPKSEISVLFNPDEPVCGSCAHGKTHA